MIRQTICSYADKLSGVDWFQNFKVATVQALRRRLVQHRPSIVGQSSYDVQLAYLQLEARVDAMLSLHRAIKKWLEGQQESLLTATLQPFATLLSHLILREVPLARDLSVVLSYALFQGMLEKRMCVSAAIANFDVQVFGILDETRGEGREAAAEEGAPAPAAQGDSAVKQEPDEGARQPPAKRQPLPRQRGRRTKPVDLGSKTTAASSAHHFATILMEGFRTYVVAMPTALFGDVGVLRAFLEEVQDMYSEFSHNG